MLSRTLLSHTRVTTTFALAAIGAGVMGWASDAAADSTVQAGSAGSGAPVVPVAAEKPTKAEESERRAEAKPEAEAEQPTAAKPTEMDIPPAADRVSPLAPDAPKFRYQVLGVLRVQSLVVQNDPNVAFVGRSDGFQLQNARLGIHGQLGSRVAIELSLDGAIDERLRANDINGRIRPVLRDAYADLALGSSLSGLSLRVGRFAIVMDPDGMIAVNRRAFVDRSLQSRGVRPTEGYETDGLPPGRSLGAALRLDPGTVTSGAKPGFEVAVQNGADEFASANDNDSFAISASGFLRLPQQGFLIATGRWNPRTIGQVPALQDETDLEAEVSGMARLGPVEVVGGGTVRYRKFDTVGGPSQVSFGAQAQAMYFIPSDLPIGIGYRFSILDPSSLVLTDRVMEHTAGLTLTLTKVRSRLLLNVTHVSEQAQRQLSNDRVQAAIEVTL